jgi:hypothetical protein
MSPQFCGISPQGAVLAEEVEPWFGWAASGGAAKQISPNMSSFYFANPTPEGIWRDEINATSECAPIL